MKIEDIRPWMIITAAVALLIYGGTVAVAYDQIKTKTTELNKTKERNATHRKKIEMYEQALSDSSKKLADMGAQLDQLMALKKQEVEAKANQNDAQNQAAPAPPQSQEPTPEEILAEYRAGGISGIPANISSAIIDKASSKRSAKSAVREIEREAKGYLDVAAYDKPGTRIPLPVRDSISADAKRKYPGNWSMTADEISKQTAAWGTLQEWYRNGVPGMDSRQSTTAIQRAIRDHPNDWSMIIVDINDDANRPARR